ncbi:hypothetical protein AAJ76_1340002275 [Vairimorpha ceranae]|uniref:Uncharacterized protein n=1 Tax=Vairimorpha ceranae TaxID=40302 RepID=A0A0F9Z7W4_9MICR|nr:hypothetical protein AAJ76_1340002275 [Vairimorpha ceranae]KKO74029.1 hypothetical protein AAJ76_1340002275 [Vairimorpha ceranae]
MLHTEEELENILNNFKERILVKNCLECGENFFLYRCKSCLLQQNKKT